MQWANQEGSVSWTVNIPETGVYNIKMIYEALESNTNDVEFSLLIDGEAICNSVKNHAEQEMDQRI